MSVPDPTTTPWVPLGGASIPPAASLTKIADTTLASATASIVFSSIPQTFLHLLLLAKLRGVTGTGLAAALRLNNDAGANYDWQFCRANGATASGTESLTATWARIGSMTNNTQSGAGWYSSAVVFIPDYTNPAHARTGVSISSTPQAGSTGQLIAEMLLFNYRVGGAGTSQITLLEPAGSTLAAGSRASLYGVG